jgi:microcystin-dependent protein
MDPFLGEIRMVGFNFAPNGWAFCNGQLLPISQYSALFSLLGTTFGGNGTTTFALPDLQGRMPLHFGAGAGLPVYNLGEKAGQASVSLTTQNLPAHAHSVAPAVSNAAATASSPVNATPAVAATTISGGQRGETATTNAYGPAVTGQVGASFQSGLTGGGLPISVEPPFLAVNFIIALNGIFPSRS